MEKEKTYTISNISEEQLNIMKKALDMYTRMGILQFGHVFDAMFNSFEHDTNLEYAYSMNRERIEKTLLTIRGIIVQKDPELVSHGQGNWSLGIGSDKTPNCCKVAYEIENEIMNATSDRQRSGLDLTDNTRVIVGESNQRIEKLNKIIEQIKEKQDDGI